MIILDTNVISAVMKAEANPKIVQWFNRQPRKSVWTTAVTVFELRSGIERLPSSRKRREMETQLAAVLTEDIEDRVLSFDQAAASEAATLTARRERNGTPIDFRDTLIAGIVVSRRAEFATRNVRHFADLDLPVFNPWGD